MNVYTAWWVDITYCYSSAKARRRKATRWRHAFACKHVPTTIWNNFQIQTSFAEKIKAEPSISLGPLVNVVPLWAKSWIRVWKSLLTFHLDRLADMDAKELRCIWSFLQKCNCNEIFSYIKQVHLDAPRQQHEPVNLCCPWIIGVTINRIISEN